MGEVKSNECWACAKPLKRQQVLCTECNQFQGWRRYTKIPTTTLALLTALITALVLLVDRGSLVWQYFFPSQEISLKGTYSVNDKSINLSVTNWGDVPAGFSSNLRCVFNLPNAIGYPEGTDLGDEVEFWSNDWRVIDAKGSVEIVYLPQQRDFKLGSDQVVCFVAMNYLNDTKSVIYELLKFVPEKNKQWLGVEAFHPLSLDEANLLYPRYISE